MIVGTQTRGLDPYTLKRPFGGRYAEYILRTVTSTIIPSSNDNPKAEILQMSRGCHLGPHYEHWLASPVRNAGDDPGNSHHHLHHDKGHKALCPLSIEAHLFTPTDKGTQPSRARSLS